VSFSGYPGPAPLSMVRWVHAPNDRFGHFVLLAQQQTQRNARVHGKFAVNWFIKNLTETMTFLLVILPNIYRF